MNADPEDLYCKLYIDADEDRDALVERLAGWLGADRDGKTLLTDVAEIEVRFNDDFVTRDQRADPDDFVYFRFALDILPRPGADRRRYVETIARLLTRAWEEGWQAVAASDFEDELPRRGGYAARS